MTVYKQIENKVLKSKDGTLFFTSSFPGYDEEYVGQVLSGLCRKDILVRIAFGIYLKPVRSRTQVPMRSEYITTGSARVIKIGNRSIALKRSVPRNKLLTDIKTSIDHDQMDRQ